MKRFLIGMVVAFASGACLSQSTAIAQQALVIKPLAEKKVTELPAGPLVWRLENFPTLAQAEAAAGSTALVAQSAGKVWLFTLGPKGASTPGGSKVAEIGPVPALTAPEYLLRINYTGGPAGVKTPIHTHPGSEAFYILTGRLGMNNPYGTMHVDAGKTMNGHSPEMPMQVFSAGPGELNALVMFVVDATRPFSSPARLP